MPANHGWHPPEAPEEKLSNELKSTFASSDVGKLQKLFSLLIKICDGDVVQMKLLLKKLTQIVDVL